jgi:hypothetical protein
VNSGGTSSPRAAVAARETSGHGGSGMASSLLPFLADGDLQKQEKNTTGSRFFFPCFKICISLVFFMGFIFFSSTSGSCQQEGGMGSGCESAGGAVVFQLH